MGFLKRNTDFTNKKSISYKLRKKRMELFERLVGDNNLTKILDIGGTQIFWNSIEYSNLSKSQITLLNLEKQETTSQNFKSVIGNAIDMRQFRDKEFDIVFSNSVIEHVGDCEKQRKMAEEIKRVGVKFFIQTPNKYFPIETHFLFPFFQFLPKSLKIYLLTHYKIGQFKKARDKKEAENIIKSVRLLTEKELQALFPEAEIYIEKVFGFTKSLIVYSK